MPKRCLKGPSPKKLNYTQKINHEYKNLQAQNKDMPKTSKINH